MLNAEVDLWGAFVAGLGDRILRGARQQADALPAQAATSQQVSISPLSISNKAESIGQSGSDGSLTLAAGPTDRMKPDPDATGPHSTFRRAPDGSIQNYQTWEQNPVTRQSSPVLRHRGSGGPQGQVQPPLVLERRTGKGAEAARATTPGATRPGRAAAPTTAASTAPARPAPSTRAAPAAMAFSSWSSDPPTSATHCTAAPAPGGGCAAPPGGCARRGRAYAPRPPPPRWT